MEIFACYGESMRALLLLAAACHFESGQIPGGGHGDSGSRDVTHAGSDAELPGCTARWAAGPTFDDATLYASVNAIGTLDDPFVSYDGLEVYVLHAGDIYVAKRGTAADPFDAPVLEPGLSTQTTADYKASLTRDGLEAVVSTKRNQPTGDTDMWRDTRASKADQFDPTPDTFPYTSVNTNANDWDPHISGDGLRLYFAPGDGTAQHISIAVRSDRASKFGNPRQITELAASGATDNDVTLSEDELVVVFMSTRGSGRRMYYATRADAAAAFSTPVEVPISSPGTQTGPHLSADGCTLYYIVGGALASRDLQ
jgi:hypothetical protein